MAKIDGHEVNIHLDGEIITISGASADVEALNAKLKPAAGSVISDISGDKFQFNVEKMLDAAVVHNDANILEIVMKINIEAITQATQRSADELSQTKAPQKVGSPEKATTANR